MINKEKDLVQLREVVLEKINRQMKVVFSPEQLSKMEISFMGDQYEHFAMDIKSSMYGERKYIEEKVYFDTYATWWDFFKAQNFPKWLLKKFPAKEVTKTKVVSFERNYLFPSAYVRGDSYLGKFIIWDNDLKQRND